VQVLDSVTVRTGQGEARWWFGTLAEIKVTAAETGGQLSVVEVTCPPDYNGVRHIHHNEDEAFWLLDGHMTLEVDGEEIEMNAGDFAFGPRNVPHSFRTAGDGCRVLFILTPGGFENLIMATSMPAATRTTPPHSDEKPDVARMQKIVAQFGGEILL
jgi:quercetin dioxygenase-like cupin family protein